jgi:two-component system, OmpR family, sensor kinase
MPEDRNDALVDLNRLLLVCSAHDIRSKLFVIAGSADVIARGADLDRSEIAAMAARMAEAAEHLSGMFEAVLDPERVDRSDTALHVDEVDVAALARRVARELEPRHAVTVTPSTFPATVDTAVVERILENLVSNIERHTPAGTAVTISLTRRGDRVAIRCTDDGPGIPTSCRESVFDRYVRLDQRGGSGLGLHFVRQLARHHHGDARVEPAPSGQGASFVVELDEPPACTVGTLVSVPA